MKKQELIKLATDKGFTSKIIGKSVDNKSIEKDFYYLWMCELQKWLRDTHNIDIIIKPWTGDNIGEKNYAADIYLFGTRTYKKLKREKTYELALEEGLFQALLI